MSGRTRKANRYVKRAMCQAAWAASHSKNTYLSAFYRRMAIKKGAPKAVMALAHHMIVVIYQVLSRKEEYVEMGGDYYDQRNKPRTIARLVARLGRLGYQVDLKLLENAMPADPTEKDNESEPPSQPDAVPEEGLGAKRKRGRPCKCRQRGIICKHQAAREVNPVDSTATFGRKIFVGFHQPPSKTRLVENFQGSLRQWFS